MAEWFLILKNGKQEGPLNEAEVGACARKGEIDEGSLCWREGMDDWAPVYTVDELSDRVKSSSGFSAGAGSTWDTLRQAFGKGKEGISRSARIAKYTLKRTQLENEKHQALAELGQLVYRKNQDAFADPEFRIVFDRIHDLDDQIAEIQGMIDEAKGA